MGISHFSGLFVLLCVGVTGALLTLAGEHGFYRLVLPHIRRRQNLKYWLHTSQKIHRALNMTYEDVKRQRAEREKSCNVDKSRPPQGPPAPPAPGASAKWNNETSIDADAAAAAAAKEARDFKRVHFNLETLNTRRLLARMAASEAKGGGAKKEGEGPAKAKEGPSGTLCENGGPAASFASLALSLNSSSSSSSSARPSASTPATSTSAPPPASTVTSPPASVAPPRPGELQELQEQIEQMRDKLRTALARRAEIETTLSKPVATVTKSPSPTTTTTTATIATSTSTTTTVAPPTPLLTTAPVTPLPANTKCVTTMTDHPHKVLSKVRPLHSRLTTQRR